MKDNIPANLDEALDIIQSMDVEFEKEWLELDETEAIAMSHHSLGLHLRNEWKLWDKSPMLEYFNKLGISHPDDMSSIILQAYHRKRNKKEIDLNGIVQHYIDYWKRLTF